jgi:hypothetical protein
MTTGTCTYLGTVRYLVRYLEVRHDDTNFPRVRAKLKMTDAATNNENNAATTGWQKLKANLLLLH